MRTFVDFHPGHIVIEHSREHGGRKSTVVAYKIEARDVRLLVEHLGPKVLVAFAQLFVWADRLAMLAQALKLNADHVTADSVAQRRNHVAIAFFAMGVMAEASKPVAVLEREGVGTVIPGSQAFARLVEMRKRWRHPGLKRYRDKVAFHADADLIWSGISRYSRRKEHGRRCGLNGGCSEDCKTNRLVVARGDGEAVLNSSLQMGSELLLVGLRVTEAEYAQAASHLADDHGRFHHRVERVFLEVLSAKGLLHTTGDDEPDED